MDIKTIQTIKWLDALKAVLIDAKLEVQTQLHPSVASLQSKLLSNTTFARSKVMEWQPATHNSVDELSDMIKTYGNDMSHTVLITQLAIDIIRVNNLILELKQ